MSLQRNRPTNEPRPPLRGSRRRAIARSTLRTVVLLGLVLVPLQLPVQAARVGDKHIGWPGATLSGVDCFGGGQGHGPLDYLTASADERNLVEGAHFTPIVEQLIRGQASGVDPLGDIDYTLRAFPNHHRALWSMSQYHLKKIKAVGIESVQTAERAHRGSTPPECYFQRAKVFDPEDKMVPAIFGIYLHKRGMLDAALKEYQEAEAKFPKHPELVYNMGLLYFDLGQIDKAQEYAERARVLGYPLDGLSRKIQRKRAEADSSANTGN